MDDEYNSEYLYENSELEKGEKILMSVNEYMLLSEDQKINRSQYLANIFIAANINVETYDVYTDVEANILNLNTQNYLHGIQLLNAKLWEHWEGHSPWIKITYKEQDKDEYITYVVRGDNLIYFYLGRVGGRRKSKSYRRSRKSIRSRKSKKRKHF